MKGHFVHEVPLSPLALEIIETLPKAGDYLFRASGEGSACNGICASQTSNLTA